MNAPSYILYAPINLDTFFIHQIHHPELIFEFLAFKATKIRTKNQQMILLFYHILQCSILISIDLTKNILPVLLLHTVRQDLSCFTSRGEHIILTFTQLSDMFYFYLTIPYINSNLNIANPMNNWDRSTLKHWHYTREYFFRCY